MITFAIVTTWSNVTRNCHPPSGETALNIMFLKLCILYGKKKEGGKNELHKLVVELL